LYEKRNTFSGIEKDEKKVILSLYTRLQTNQEDTEGFD